MDLLETSKWSCFAYPRERKKEPIRRKGQQAEED
jgi:hypothetical protein